MCHDNGKLCKIWRGIDLPFQNWHEEIDEFWLEHSKISKLVPSTVDSIEVDSKEELFKLTLEVREVFLNILVSQTGIKSRIFFVHFNKYTWSSKVSFNEHVLIWNKERNFSFWENFDDLIWSIPKYLEFRTSGEELLNRLNKSAKLGGGFERTELFLLEISM